MLHDADDPEDGSRDGVAGRESGPASEVHHQARQRPRRERSSERADGDGQARPVLVPVLAAAMMAPTAMLIEKPVLPHTCAAKSVTISAPRRRSGEPAERSHPVIARVGLALTISLSLSLRARMMNRRPFTVGVIAALPQADNCRVVLSAVEIIEQRKQAPREDVSSSSVPEAFIRGQINRCRELLQWRPSDRIVGFTTDTLRSSHAHLLLAVGILVALLTSE